jgi:hypothetical protein
VDTLQKIDWATQMVREKQRQLRHRPLKPSARGGHDPLTLTTRACSRPCDRCYMECAILPERLQWWKDELVRLQADSPVLIFDTDADVLFVVEG